MSYHEDKVKRSPSCRDLVGISDPSSTGHEGQEFSVRSKEVGVDVCGAEENHEMEALLLPTEFVTKCEVIGHRGGLQFGGAANV